MYFIGCNWITLPKEQESLRKSNILRLIEDDEERRGRESGQKCEKLSKMRTVHFNN